MRLQKKQMRRIKFSPHEKSRHRKPEIIKKNKDVKNAILHNQSDKVEDDRQSKLNEVDRKRKNTVLALEVIRMHVDSSSSGTNGEHKVSEQGVQNRSDEDQYENVKELVIQKVPYCKQINDYHTR